MWLMSPEAVFQSSACACSKRLFDENATAKAVNVRKNDGLSVPYRPCRLLIWFGQRVDF
jgi:hypothetical protein